MSFKVYLRQISLFYFPLSCWVGQSLLENKQSSGPWESGLGIPVLHIHLNQHFDLWKGQRACISLHLPPRHLLAGDVTALLFRLVLREAAPHACKCLQKLYWCPFWLLLASAWPFQVLSRDIWETVATITCFFQNSLKKYKHNSCLKSYLPKHLDDNRKMLCDSEKWNMSKYNPN